MSLSTVFGLVFLGMIIATAAISVGSRLSTRTDAPAATPTSSVDRYKPGDLVCLNLEKNPEAWESKKLIVIRITNVGVENYGYRFISQDGSESHDVYKNAFDFVEKHSVPCVVGGLKP